MNQLNEEIRILQIQISLLENQLWVNKGKITDNDRKRITDHIISLRFELLNRLEQTKEVPI